MSRPDGENGADRAAVRPRSAGRLDTVSQRYRVEPAMSYVDAATKAKDPAFWGKKP
jgi:hypothetical protein